MRLFIDSSVLFAMCYSKTGGARELMRLAIRDRVYLFVSDYVLEETATTLEEKAAHKLVLFDYIRRRDVWHIVNADRDEVIAAMGVTTDKLDVPIVAAAKKASVDALLSFDRKHLHTRAVVDFIGAVVTTPDMILKQIQAK
jgi:predicted nucleic acid-binding protein